MLYLGDLNICILALKVGVPHFLCYNGILIAGGGKN